MMDCGARIQKGPAVNWVRDHGAMWTFTKKVGIQVAKNGSDWFESSTEPHIKESMDGKVWSIEPQGFDLLLVK
jgi:hypothetical protein